MPIAYCQYTVYGFETETEAVAMFKKYNQSAEILSVFKQLV